MWVKQCHKPSPSHHMFISGTCPPFPVMGGLFFYCFTHINKNLEISILLLVKSPCSYGFSYGVPMVFLWFSYGFTIYDMVLPTGTVKVQGTGNTLAASPGECWKVPLGSTGRGFRRADFAGSLGSSGFSLWWWLTVCHGNCYPTWLMVI